MGVPKQQKSQIKNQQQAFVNQLQIEARNLFYDQMMYEVNDSLTSILAVCDTDAKNSIPRIKENITKINQSLKTAKSYQSNHCSVDGFNATAVVKNLVRVLRDNFKDISLVSFISDIKGNVKCDQNKFERIFLHLFTSVFIKSGSEAFIELKQKDNNAVITLFQNSCSLSNEALEGMQELAHIEFQGDVQVLPSKSGVEVAIALPLQFKAITLSRPVIKKKESKPKEELNAKIDSDSDDTASKWGFFENQFAPEFVY